MISSSLSSLFQLQTFSPLGPTAQTSVSTSSRVLPGGPGEAPEVKGEESRKLYVPSEVLLSSPTPPHSGVHIKDV